MHRLCSRAGTGPLGRNRDNRRPTRHGRFRKRRNAGAGIIPVSSSGSVTDWYRQVVDVSTADGLVNVNLEHDIADRFLGLPWVKLAEIDQAGTTQFSTHPTCVRPGYRLANQAPLLSGPGVALWE